MNIDIKHLFGMTVVDYNKKDILRFFIILLIPNLLRQIIYYTTFIKSGSVGFIVSFETVQIYNSFPFLGVLEEIIIGIVFTFFWFKFIRLRFFSYGWVSDALIDFISVLSWIIIGYTPLQLLGFNNMTEFLFREIILSYFVFGILFFRYRFNLNKLVVGFTGFGIFVLLISLIFA